MNGLKLTFANVGYGEAILVQAEDSTCQDGVFTMVIDGGSGEAEEFADSRSGRMPFMDFLRDQQISHIDLLVNTHIHEDHTCGLLPAAEYYRPRMFWQTLPEEYYLSMHELDAGAADTPSGRKFLQAINDYRAICRTVSESSGVIAKKCASGESVTLSPGLTLRVLAPTEEKAAFLLELMEDIRKAEGEEALREARNRADAAMNNLSLILQLEYAGRRILLPGDTNREGYGDTDADLHADIFKVGHHGQKDGISRELFRRIRPSYVVCCASSDRRYESAAPQILQMMREEGAALYYSDCPDVPPWTDGVKPHHALTFTISPEGGISVVYDEGCCC